MIKREMRCAINPAVGDERFLHIIPAAKKLNVGIAGGGIAGMEAARIAMLRGHKVTIFEKENELGGILRACCMVPPKDKMKWYLDWIRRQISKLGVEVRLNTEATPENLKNFDVVLCASGAKTVVPKIPGADKAVKFEDILVCSKKNCEYWPKEGKRAAVKVGDRVVIWGNHYAASDTAEALGLRGKEITIVTEDREFCPNIEPIHREVMMMRFAGGNGQGLEGTPFKKPVTILTGTTIVEIKDSEVIVMDGKFNTRVIPCDTVVFAKTESDDTLFRKLLEAGFPVANIGDSKLVRNLRGAVMDGAETALILDEGLFVNSNGMLCNDLPVDVRLMME